MNKEKTRGKQFMKLFIGLSSLSTNTWPIRLEFMVHVSLALKRKIYHFKNSLSPNYVSFIGKNYILPGIYFAMFIGN